MANLGVVLLHSKILLMGKEEAYHTYKAKNFLLVKWKTNPNPS